MSTKLGMFLDKVRQARRACIPASPGEHAILDLIADLALAVFEPPTPLRFQSADVKPSEGCTMEATGEKPEPATDEARDSSKCTGALEPKPSPVSEVKTALADRGVKSAVRWELVGGHSLLHHMVKDFHVKFGHAVRHKPFVPSREEVRFRLQLIREEFFELMSACNVAPTAHLAMDLKHKIETANIHVDLPEFMDACGDLDYVVEGTRLVFGVNGLPIAYEIQRANMEKFPSGPLFKPTKPEGWKPPDIAGCLEAQRQT